jgi:hypothetical protein
MSVSAAVLFQDGFIACPPWTNQFFKFPDTIIPTALALTNSNEFILVTVWDVTNPSQPKGRLAVRMVHWGLPVTGIGNEIHYMGSDDVKLWLMGYVDLPFAAPTFVAATGNTGYIIGDDVYFAPSIGDLATAQGRANCSQTPTDPYSTCANNVASSGYAIVLSRWENKAAIIDLQPLYQYIQTWLLGSQQNYDDATGGSTLPTPGHWPRTFDVAPEEKPVIAYTLDIPHPLPALAGRGGHNINQDPSERIQAHISSLDGTVRSYDIHHLVNRHAQTPTSPVELASFQTGYNPISMAWAGDVDPLDPTSSTLGNPRGDYSDSYMVLSRARREIQWVYMNGAQNQVFRSLRDSRLDDPANLDRNNGFPYAYVVSVSDFTSRKVVTYRIGPLGGELQRPPQDLPPPSGDASIECGGELELSGNVFQMNGANVP